MGDEEAFKAVDEYDPSSCRDIFEDLLDELKMQYKADRRVRLCIYVGFKRSHVCSCSLAQEA